MNTTVDLVDLKHSVDQRVDVVTGLTQGSRVVTLRLLGVRVSYLPLRRHGRQ